MYARNYYPEKDPETGIPKNYGGTALRDLPAAEQAPPPPPPSEESERPVGTPSVPTDCPPKKNPWELPPPQKKSGGIFNALFGLFPLGIPQSADGIGGMFRALTARLAGMKSEGAGIGFESEDLLILALAALLFFSKSGDKECALMLLFLLFIR